MCPSRCGQAVSSVFVAKFHTPTQYNAKCCNIPVRYSRAIELFLHLISLAHRLWCILQFWCLKDPSSLYVLQASSLVNVRRPCSFPCEYKPLADSTFVGQSVISRPYPGRFKLFLIAHGPEQRKRLGYLVFLSPSSSKQRQICLQTNPEGTLQYSVCPFQI